MIQRFHTLGTPEVWLKPRVGQPPAFSVPVLLVHGRQDKSVPFGHGQWLAAHIPGLQARLLDDEGHLSLAEHQVGDVHSWLSEHLHS